MPTELQLILAAVLSVVALILLVTRLRVHPFLALLVASLILGFLAGLVPTDIIKNFGKGFGDVMGSVGIIIGLGTMLGGVLVISGGADRLATSLTSIGGKKWVPWTTFFVALLIGLPLFFEVGFVLLVPIALAIAKKVEMPILRVGLPMLAGLSIAHGLVPPHPAPTLAVETFHADPGKTILLAIIVGLPTGLFAGPIFSRLAQAWLNPAGSPVDIEAAEASLPGSAVGGSKENPPDLPSVLVTILLPPLLMLGRSVVELAKPAGSIKQAIDFVGDPITALLIALCFAIGALGFRRGWSAATALQVVGNSLAPIAAVVFIVGAGGGFKQMLIATKISDLVGTWATHANISPLLLGWGVAALVRIATGSATVATITAAGLVAQIVEHDPTVSRELMVLATGSGSLILSHVNDAGFWLVKEYFGLTVVETFKSWTVMETILSVLGLILVLGLSLVIH
jgi:GntP family gluconate:H+ symporter